MSLIDTARDALKGLPISDIVRERLSLALDRLSEAESKNSDLQTQVGRMQSDLDRERLDHQQTRDELKRLQELFSEDVRIHKAVEFRKGRRTGGHWIAFCPKCHMPVHDPDIENRGAMCSADCGWESHYSMAAIEAMAAKIE